MHYISSDSARDSSMCALAQKSVSKDSGRGAYHSVKTSPLVAKVVLFSRKHGEKIPKNPIVLKNLVRLFGTVIHSFVVGSLGLPQFHHLFSSFDH